MYGTLLLYLDIHHRLEKLRTFATGFADSHIFIRMQDFRQLAGKKQNTGLPSVSSKCTGNKCIEHYKETVS
jgi:hypothetical protein